MSDSKARNISSPVKSTAFNTANREHRSSVLEQKGLPASNDFVERHLNVPEGWERLISRHTRRKVEAVKKAPAHPGCYATICSLLNSISNAIYKSLSKSEETDVDKLLFYDSHASPLSHHPLRELKDKSRPDFITVKQKLAKLAKYQKTAAGNYHKIPWHHVESVGEWKGKTRDGLAQSVVYVGSLNQARPDKPGVYALSASGRDYQVTWSDAAGHPCSALYSWDELEALVGYVYSLYRPPPDHVTVDSTIVRSPLATGETHLDVPLWDITFDLKTHRRCEVIFVGEAWTRMTWVVRSELQTIIKDSYVSDLRTWKEAQLLDILHKNGYIEGWVQSSASGEVKNGENSIRTVGSKVARTKTRSVMETRGEAIHACPSVLHFLKVMYDALEAHRFAVDKRRILHRDISITNILILPEGMPRRPETGDRPRFIDEILNPSEPNESKSYALIIDLDNGRELLPFPDPNSTTPPANADSLDATSSVIKKKAEVDLAVHGRSGTPMFIARSVSQGVVLNISPHTVLPMPTLPADVAHNYALAHSGDVYRTRTDAPGLPHGGAPNQQLWQLWRDLKPTDVKYDHHPRHDAESVYWVIVAFLLRARPLLNPIDPETQTDTNNVALISAWRSLSRHEIGNSDDSRSCFLTYSITQWETVLHVKLKGLGILLRDLTDQIAPEYAFLTPGPKELHLHEAMQRIILKHIWNMTQDKLDIPLDRIQHRAVHEIQLIRDAPTVMPAFGHSGQSIPRESQELYAQQASGGSRSSNKRSVSEVEGPSNTPDAKKPRSSTGGKTRNVFRNLLGAMSSVARPSGSRDQEPLETPDLNRQASRQSLRISESQKGKTPSRYPK